MSAKDPDKKVILNYEVFWKSATLGYVQDVDPSGVTEMRKEKTIGNFGPIVIDRVLQGLQGQIKTILEQPDLDTIKQLCPWWSTGVIPVVAGSLYHSEYANAGELRWHPYGVDVGTVTNDVVLLKAYPQFKWPKGNGNDWSSLEVNWNFYPDLDELEAGSLVYGYRGALPA